MAVKYKQKCSRCGKYVPITRRQVYLVCPECQEKELAGEVKDPEMKKLFKIPIAFYRENAFLRSIKLNYLRYGNLSERQIEAFEKTVAEMKASKN